MIHPRLDRSHRHTFDLCDLVVGQPVKEGEADDQLLNGLKPGKTTSNPRSILSGSQHRLRVRSVVDLIGDFFDETQPGALSDPIDVLVSGDSEDPRFDARHPAEPTGRSPDLQHGIMKHVLGGVRIATARAEEAPQVVGVSLVDHAHGRPVSTGDLLQQLPVTGVDHASVTSSCPSGLSRAPDPLDPLHIDLSGSKQATPGIAKNFSSKWDIVGSPLQSWLAFVLHLPNVENHPHGRPAI